MKIALTAIRDILSKVVEEHDLTIHGYDFADLKRALEPYPQLTFNDERSRRGDFLDFSVSLKYDNLLLNIDFTTNRKHFSVYQSDLTFAGRKFEWFHSNGKSYVEDGHDDGSNALLSEVVDLVVDAC